MDLTESITYEYNIDVPSILNSTRVFDGVQWHPPVADGVQWQPVAATAVLWPPPTAGGIHHPPLMYTVLRSARTPKYNGYH